MSYVIYHPLVNIIGWSIVPIKSTCQRRSCSLWLCKLPPSYHSDAVSTPRGGAYSPSAQELAIVHRDSITVQPRYPFNSRVRRSNAGKVSYPSTQRTMCPCGESNPGPWILRSDDPHWATEPPLDWLLHTGRWIIQLLLWNDPYFKPYNIMLHLTKFISLGVMTLIMCYNNVRHLRTENCRSYILGYLASHQNNEVCKHYNNHGRPSLASPREATDNV